MSTLPKTKKIAITGLIGSGKSSVLAYLKKRGYKVFSADKFVAELYSTDTSLAKQIQRLTNENILSNGLIDKQKLSALFFKSSSLKKEIEQIVHKRVYDTIFSDKMDALFYEIPLLFESGYQTKFDEVILVISSLDIQIKRLQETRNLSLSEIEERLNAQMSVEDKIKGSDVLFINNYDLDTLYYQIDRYLERAGL